MAMGGVFLPGNKNFALSVNTGHYDGNTAFAASGAANLGDNWYLSGSVGVGLEEGKWGGRAGLTYAW